MEHERESIEEIVGYLQMCAATGNDELAHRIIGRLTDAEAAEVRSRIESYVIDLQRPHVDEYLRRLEQLEKQ